MVSPLASPSSAAARPAVIGAALVTCGAPSQRGFRRRHAGRALRGKHADDGVSAARLLRSAPRPVSRARGQACRSGGERGERSVQNRPRSMPTTRSSFVGLRVRRPRSAPAGKAAAIDPPDPHRGAVGERVVLACDHDAGADAAHLGRNLTMRRPSAGDMPAVGSSARMVWLGRERAAMAARRRSAPESFSTAAQRRRQAHEIHKFSHVVGIFAVFAPAFAAAWRHCRTSTIVR